MTYQVTARRWRPMVFDDVIGQSHVTNTLRNAIAANRVAHAYVFSGTRGCGKTTTARILARALNCRSPINQNPDNTCDICREIIDGRGMDVIEIDGASNRGVEEIRNLRDSVRYAPTHGKYKIYIIDEVHMLTKEAFNALLKTLEEPPANVVFIFATTEVHKMPMTILSRCQRFDFRRIAVDEIVKSLTTIAAAENVTIERDALLVIAKRAEGSLRDAQSIFDQVRSFCGNDIKTAELLKAFNVVDREIYFGLTALLRKHDSRATIELVDKIFKNAYDVREFLSGLTEHFRNLLIVRSTSSTQLIELPESDKKQYEIEGAQFSEQDLLRYIRQTNELDQALRWAAHPRYILEAGLLQMALMEGSVQIGDLLQQINDLKKKLTAPYGEELQRAMSGPVRRGEPPALEVKVIGEVGAGNLRSKSAVSYASLAGMDLAKFAGVPRLDEPRPKAPFAKSPGIVINTVSPDEIQERWPDFVNGVSKMRIAVGATLKEAQVLDVHNGLVRIACPDDFNLSTLKRNKEFLSDAFQEIIGKRVSIELVLDSQAGITAKAALRSRELSYDNDGKQKENLPQESPTKGEHPILSLLKRELGAEKIE
jgi:DNA polymerase-3 subunit gamma/tau